MEGDLPTVMVEAEPEPSNLQLVVRQVKLLASNRGCTASLVVEAVSVVAEVCPAVDVVLDASMASASAYPQYNGTTLQHYNFHSEWGTDKCKREPAARTQNAWHAMTD